MRIFKRRFTNWIPLGSYLYSGRDHVVFVRRKISNGMLSFKTKKMGSWNSYSHGYFSHNIIDTARAWKAIND